MNPISFLGVFFGRKTRSDLKEIESKGSESFAFDREVADELRRDALANLWHRHGNFIMALAAGVLLAVAGTQFWQARQLAAAEAAAAQFQAADALARDNKADEARKAFDGLVANSPKGVATLARLRLAALSLKAEHPAEALATFEAIAADGSADSLLRGYARLEAAALRLSEADFTEMQNRLNDLGHADNAWHMNARELLGFSALKAGQMDTARNTFAGILADRQAPADMVERAQVAMGRIVEAELAKAVPAGAGPSPVPGNTALPAPAPAPAEAGAGKK